MQRRERERRDRWIDEQLGLPLADERRRCPRLAPEAVKLAIERSHRLETDERIDRELLRRALRWLVEALTLHVEVNYKIFLDGNARRFFSVAGAVNDLFDVLLELNALDLAGVAELLRSGDDKKIRAARRQRARRETQLYGALRSPQPQSSSSVPPGQLPLFAWPWIYRSYGPTNGGTADSTR